MPLKDTLFTFVSVHLYICISHNLLIGILCRHPELLSLLHYALLTQVALFFQQTISLFIMSPPQLVLFSCINSNYCAEQLNVSSTLRLTLALPHVVKQCSVLFLMCINKSYLNLNLSLSPPCSISPKNSEHLREKICIFPNLTIKSMIYRYQIHVSIQKRMLAFFFFRILVFYIYLPPNIVSNLIRTEAIITTSVQFSSVTQLCLTPCDPMNRSKPGLPVHHQLLGFTQTQMHRVSDAIQPSHPLSSPSPPAPNPSQHQGLFQ